MNVALEPSLCINRRPRAGGVHPSPDSHSPVSTTVTSLGKECASGWLVDIAYLKMHIPIRLWLLKRGTGMKVMMRIPEFNQPPGEPPTREVLPGPAAVPSGRRQTSSPMRQRFQGLK